MRDLANARHNQRRGITGVYRLVAGRGLVQRELEAEHLAGVDLEVPNQVDELGQEPADRGEAAVQVDAGRTGP